MDLATPRSIPRRFKHGTLVIVCLATMMLLLDIAVVNSHSPRFRATCTRV